MKNSRYSDVFTVSTEEVVDYVLKNGIPENELARSKSYEEGFHFFKENGKWHTYFYEREITSYEKSFEDDIEAKIYSPYADSAGRDRALLRIEEDFDAYGNPCVFFCRLRANGFYLVNYSHIPHL